MAHTDVHKGGSVDFGWVWLGFGFAGLRCGQQVFYFVLEYCQGVGTSFKHHFTGDIVQQNVAGCARNTGLAAFVQILFDPGREFFAIKAFLKCNAIQALFFGQWCQLVERKPHPVGAYTLIECVVVLPEGIVAPLIVGAFRGFRLCLRAGIVEVQRVMPVYPVDLAIRLVNQVPGGAMETLAKRTLEIRVFDQADDGIRIAVNVISVVGEPAYVL